MVETLNPWSAVGWNLTAQAAYVRQYGQARAEARARDAGAVLGGKRPPLPAPMGGPPVVQRYVLTKGVPGAAGPPAPPSPLFVMGTANFGLGVTMAPILTRELDLVPDADAALGLDAIVAALTLELDLPAPTAALGLGLTVPGLDLEWNPAAAMDIGVTQTVTRLNVPSVPPASLDLGITEAAALTVEIDLPAAAPDLGLAEAAVLTAEIELTAAPDLGLAEDAAITLEQDLAAAPDLGIALAAALERGAVLAAAPDLGLTQTVVFSPELDLAAAPALGLTAAAALERSIVLAAAPDLGLTAAAALTRQINLAAAPALGIAVAASVTYTAPAVITKLGTHHSDYTGSQPQTQTLAVTASVAAGSLIIVAVQDFSDSFNTGPSGVTDAAGNTYHLDNSQIIDSSDQILVYSCPNCLALSSGQNISVTATRSDGLAAIGILAWSITSMKLVSPLDSATVRANNGASGNPTVTSGTPGLSGEFFVGVVGSPNMPTFTSPAGGWSTTAQQTPFGTGSYTMQGAILQRNVLTTAVYNPTASTNNSWGALIQAYKTP